MTEMQAVEVMAHWVYDPSSRPRDMLASNECIWRMCNGFNDPRSIYRQFAYDMKRTIERISA